MNNTLVVVLGPTAVGKTGVSIQLAKHFSTDILSADSRQFYREMSIGTAKPTITELNSVPHHFIDFLSTNEPYNAGRFEGETIEKLDIFFSKKEVVIMAGGSGLYIDAVCNGLDDLPSDQALRESLIEKAEDPEGLKELEDQLKKLDPLYYETADLSNTRRAIRALEVCLSSGKPYSSFRTSPKKERSFSTIKIGLKMDREELYNRINQRVDDMIESGLVEEAKSLHEKGLNALETVGYQELFEHFEGLTTQEQAIELIKRNSRRYAKRQLTWFRKDLDIKWFQPEEVDKMVEHINS